MALGAFAIISASETVKNKEVNIVDQINTIAILINLIQFAGIVIVSDAVNIGIGLMISSGNCLLVSVLTLF